MSQDQTTLINWNLEDLDAAPAWRGAVDVASPDRVAGWVFSTEKLLRPVELELLLLGTPLLVTVARVFRADIAHYVRLPIKSGFEVSLQDVQPEVAAAALLRVQDYGLDAPPAAEVLQIRVCGTDAVMPFSPGVGEGPFDLARLAQLLAPVAEQAGGGILAEKQDLLERPLPASPQPAPAQGPAEVRCIAYYMPQFYPFPERKGVRGAGFSEWAAVAAAKPLFPGHHQPRVPADLGFYDLRLDQVQAEQIKLARQYGLSGFCYSYPWAQGQAHLTLPIDRHLENGYDFDFCLCWNNELFSRHLSGIATEWASAGAASVFDSDVDFIRSCLKYFKSDRYIKIDGAPLLQVQHLERLQSPTATVARWREIAREAGFPDLHVSMVETADMDNPHSHGCDSSCQSAPPQPPCAPAKVEGLVSAFTGGVFDYPMIVGAELARKPVSWLRFRTAMPGWDTTALQGVAADVCHGATPDLFCAWLAHLVDQAEVHLPAGRRFVFIHAWNNWAEGAHLEPEKAYGHAYLGAVRHALAPATRAFSPLRAAEVENHVLAQTRHYVERLQATNKALSSFLTVPQTDLRQNMGFVHAGHHLLEVRPAEETRFGLERVNGHPLLGHALIPLPRWQGLHLEGWFLMQGLPQDQLMIALHNPETEARFISTVHLRLPRPDVRALEGLDPIAEASGFRFDGTLHDIPDGVYEVELLCPHEVLPKGAEGVPTGLKLLIG